MEAKAEAQGLHTEPNSQLSGCNSRLETAPKQQEVTGGNRGLTKNAWTEEFPVPALVRVDEAMPKAA